MTGISVVTVDYIIITTLSKYWIMITLIWFPNGKVTSIAVENGL